MGEGVGDLPSVIDWAVAARPHPGEVESGDLHVVAACPGGALVAVLDGLGHGHEAAVAAKLAAAVLEVYADEPIAALLRRVDERLRHSRGVVLTLAVFDGEQDTMTWLGVGNVEGHLFRADPATSPWRESVLLRGGGLGYQLPPLRPATVAVRPGDTIILATDGIQSRFPERLVLDDSPRRLADFILAEYAKPTDDALVLVARYRGWR